MAANNLKTKKRSRTRNQGNIKPTTHLRINVEANHGAKLNPHMNTKLKFNGEEINKFLKSKHSKLLIIKVHKLLTIKLHFEQIWLLMALGERRQRHVVKLYVLIKHDDVDSVEKNSETPIRIFDCYVDAQLEEKLAFIGEVKLV